MAYDEIQNDIERLGPRDGGAPGFVTSAQTLAGQVVTLTGDNQVAPSSTDGENVIGVTTQGVASGDTATVLTCSTVATVRASSTVSSGERVASNGATGEPGEVATAATGDFVLGVALEGIDAGGAGQVLVTAGGGEVN